MKLMLHIKQSTPCIFHPLIFHLELRCCAFKCRYYISPNFCFGSSHLRPVYTYTFKFENAKICSRLRLPSTRNRINAHRRSECSFILTGEYRFRICTAKSQNIKNVITMNQSTVNHTRVTVNVY